MGAPIKVSGHKYGDLLAAADTRFADLVDGVYILKDNIYIGLRFDGGIALVTRNRDDRWFHVTGDGRRCGSVFAQKSFFDHMEKQHPNGP